MISAEEGWAVGENGAMLHFEGNEWISYSMPITATLNSVSMSSENNGWAVGMNNTPPYKGIVYHWDGIDWESFQQPNTPWPFYMADISVPNDTSAWISGGVIICSPGDTPCYPAGVFGIIAHWDGNVWSYSQINNVYPSSISMLSDSEGWAVGTEVVQNTKEMRSNILHWDGKDWSNVAHPEFVVPPGIYQNILQEVSVLDSSHVWSAVSNQNTFLRWDGINWSEIYSPVRGKPAIAIVSSNDAWAVGSEGDIGYWDGENWTLVSSPVTTTLMSLSMISAYEGWAVGSEGTILHGVGFRVFSPIISR
jgi:hypothetical protein